MALIQSPSTVTNGLVFYYDMSNTQKSWRGRPVVNQFALPEADVNGFQVQNSTFTRIRLGQFGNYNIQGTDYVWRYNISVNDCPYHGNDVTINAGQTATFSFDYYVDPSTSNYVVTNHLAAFEGVVSGAASDPTPSIKGVWKRAVFSATAGSTGLCRMLLYPGACGGRLGDSGFILYRNPQVEFDAPGNQPSPFVAGTRIANSNLEATPSFPTWNTAAGSSASAGTLTFSGGSHNSKGSWDLYKTYSGLATGVNYTWSALVRAGTANNFIVTMNNTQSWNTGPSAVFTGLSSTEWTRVSIMGTTNTGSFNLHLGASANSEVAGTVQNAGTVFIHDVRLEIIGSQPSFVDLTGRNNIAAVSLTYESDGTFRFFGSNYIDASVTPFNMHNLNVWLYNDYAIPGNDSAIGGVVTSYQSPINFNRQTTQGINLGGWTGSATNESVHIWSNSSTNSGFNGMTHIREAVPVGWHNFQFNWNGSTYDIWIDGVKRTTFAANFGHATLHPVNAIRIGGDVAQSYYFVGRIPVVTMYNRQLSDAEVLQNFNALRGRYGI